MKKIIIITASILILISCDKIEAPYLTNDSFNPQDTTTNNYEKKILVEYFTGHLCNNCPDAARELKIIDSIYNGRIIAIAMHVSNSFARPYPESQAPSFQYDFRTEWGDNWDNFFEISEAGLPKGMINRIGYPENHKLGKNEWGSIVVNELTKSPDFGINISSNSSTINISTEVLNNVNGSYNLVVVLTENSIINWQKDGLEDIDDYKHDYVLRSVLIDENLSSSTNYTNNQEILKSIDYNLNTLEQYNIDYSQNIAFLGNGNAGNWNTTNLNIVAYIYDNTTREILQVEKVQLNTNN